MWLSGTSADEDLLRSRASQAGFDIDTQYVVCVYRALTTNGQSLPLESLTSLVQDNMSRRQMKGAVGQYIDSIVALYLLDEAQASRVYGFIEEIRDKLALRTPSGLVSAGISRPVVGLAALHDAYREARDAIKIAVELGDSEKSIFYGDLKLYRLLLALKDVNLDSLVHFHDEILAPLVKQDERKQSDLLRTLAGFFEANGNLAKAALDLSVHRNTLVYRLERISELTDMDLDDADNRLILHLALKIQRVLATLPH